MLKRKIILSFIVLVIISCKSFSQEILHDPEAKKVLEGFTSKIKKSYPVRADFTYTMKNLQTNDNFTDSGSIVIDNNKYKLNIMDSEIYSDGKTIWNYLPDANEVNISEPDPYAEDAFLNNPAELFQVYNENFKYRYVGKKQIDGKQIHEIDMFPYDLEKDFSRIKLMIEDKTLKLNGIQVFYKSGETYILNIKEFIPQFSAPSGFFVFKPENHPGVEVIDMRF